VHGLFGQEELHGGVTVNSPIGTFGNGTLVIASRFAA